MKRKEARSGDERSGRLRHCTRLKNGSLDAYENPPWRGGFVGRVVLMFHTGMGFVFGCSRSARSRKGAGLFRILPKKNAVHNTSAPFGCLCTCRSSHCGIV